jgi:magnesium chelatase family protein
VHAAPLGVMSWASVARVRALLPIHMERRRHSPKLYHARLAPAVVLPPGVPRSGSGFTKCSHPGRLGTECDEESVQASITERCSPLRSQVFSVSLAGLVATLVTITVTLEPGRMGFEVIGLDEHKAREMKRLAFRVLERAGERLAPSRVEVRFAPPGVRHVDTLYLAFVVALRLALENRSLPDTVLVGAVWPSGHLRPVPGAVPTLLGAGGISRAIVPRENGPETACVPGTEVLVARDLWEVLDCVRGEGTLASAGDVPSARLPCFVMREVPSLHEGRRALEIAAAGFHHLLLIGSHASGAVGLGCRLPSVMPELTRQEVLEATSIHSFAGLLFEEHFGALTLPPFRIPDPSLSIRRLIGGAHSRLPGEVSFAHHGVLYVRSIQSWRPEVLAKVDQVLGEGRAQLAEGISFPARPLVVASAVPCPCGFYRTHDRTCTCTPERVRNYRSRLRGPVLDRVDLWAQLSGTVAGPRGESSAKMRARVVIARKAQRRRWVQGEASAAVNGQLGIADLERVARPDADGRRVMRRAGLSPELVAKVLSVARTIADLDGSDAVRARHKEEAVQFAPDPTVLRARVRLSTAALPCARTELKRQLG